MIVNNSTINGNTSYYSGGIACGSNSSYPSHITINYSTICGNRALLSSNGGGGIYSWSLINSGNPTIININNSTITDNSSVGLGGGIYLYSSPTVATLLNIKSSIVALNSGGNLFSIQTPLFISGGFNVFSDTVLVGTISSDQIAIDSLALNIGGLAFNGGLTQTKMPFFPSVALNNGNPNDIANAQNVPIVGVRDVGAAEFCSTTTFVDTVVECNSYFHWVDGNTYFLSNNTASFQTVNAAGCDSIMYLDLTLNHTESIDSILTCNSYYTWVNGETYTSNNFTAIDTLINSVGCDSVVFLALTINSLPSTDTVVVCNSYYTWMNGVTYTASTNQVTDTLVNTSGCDSVVTLNLTILFPPSIDLVDACNSYTWINGVTYYSSNFSATDTINNSAGCDSVITLNLSVFYSTSNTDTITSCVSYTWVDGVTYYSSNSSASKLYTGSNNCDSLVLLHLTIIGVDTSVVSNGNLLTAQAANASFQWIDCNLAFPILGETNAQFAVSSSGSYQVEITQNGCIDTSECFTYLNVGLESIVISDQVIIYPNPIRDQFTVEVNNWNTKEMVFTLTDITGNFIETKRLNNVIGKQRVHFFTSHLSRGVYFIRISDGENSVSTKLVLN